MRICLVHRDLHGVTRGGICTIYRSLAPRLREAGHHVTLLTQHTTIPIHLSGVEVVTLPRTEDLAAHRQGVAAALTEIAPDVVECSSWEAEALDYLQQPAERRAPVVVRGDLSAVTMQASELIDAEKALVHQAERVIAVSDFAARDLAAVYNIPRPKVVANGVDRDTFRRGPVTTPSTGYQVTLTSTGQVTSRTRLADLATSGQLPAPWARHGGLLNLVWVGKITPMKGWDQLEQLVPRLTNRARLTILLGHSPAFCPVTLTGGNLDDVEVIQDLADSDLPSFYRAADYLLCTSRWEGFGLAIAEALACGTPVLVPSELGTATELLSDSITSRYTSHDHLLQMLTNGDRPVARLAARFDWDRNTTATLAHYTALTRRSSRIGRPVCAS